MCDGGTSQTSTVSIPPEVLANYQKVFGMGEQIASKPFQEYSKDPNAFVAGLTPTQQAAMQNVNAIQGMASGDVAAGQQMIGAGAEAGTGLQQASLGTAAEGQGVGSQLYGKSMGTSEAGLGAASRIYGQAMPQISQAAQIGQRYGQDAAQNLYAGVGLAKPYMGEAANLTRAGLGAGQQYASLAGDYLGAGTQNVGVGDLNTEKYMSPYISQVVKATQALQAQENEAQRSALKGEAIRAGAFGGDRAGVAQANLARQQSLANQSTLSNILQQGYSQAQGVAGQQQQLGLSADQANRAAQQFGAQQASAMGQQQFGQMATAAQQQAAIGQALYGQNLGQGQAIAGLGQQLYGQRLGAAQAEAGIGKDIYGMSAQQAQLQQAAAQGMFGQAAQVAALQQGAGNNMFNYGLQGGQGVANLGLANQQAQLAAAQAQMQMGQIQQQTDQAGKTALYNQFTQQQGFPYQQVQFLGNLAMGTGALSGSTTTTTGSSGGIFSDRRLKENVEKIGKTYDGQPIYRYNYKGEKATQIGLMADESTEKAVGHSQGYKTLDYKKATEKAAKRGHFYEGGLVPASMGGAVNVDNAYEEYNRGGYVGGGMVPTSPDEDGNMRYAYAEETPEDAAAKAAADESAAAAKIDPRINAAYQDLMFRDADPEGAKYWQEQLDRGASFEDVKSGIGGSRERQLVNQIPLTYDASKFQPAAAPVMNRYGAASAPMGSYASSFQPQPSYAPAATGGYGQQAPQYGYGPQMGYGQPQASGKGPSAGGSGGYGGYQQPSQMSQFNQGYGGSYLNSPQASGKGVGPSSYQSNYGYSNPSSMGAPAPQASGKGPSTGSSSPSSNATAAPKLQRGGRAGYLAGGIVDPNDLAALAAQRMSQLAPHAAGMPGQSLPGGQSAIPNKLMHVPKLITSNARLPEQANPFNQAVSMAEKINSLGKLTDKGNILSKEGFLRKTLDRGIEELPKGAQDTISSISGSTPAAASGPTAPAPKVGDRPAAGASLSEYVPESSEEGRFFIPEYVEEPEYAKGGLVPEYALGGALPYGGGVAGGGYIPEELLEQQKIQGLPRDSEQLKAAGAKAMSGGSGGLGDVMKLGNMGYKLAPEGMKAGLKSMFAGTEAAAPAVAEGLGAAAPAAAEAAAGLGAIAPAAAEAAGLGAAGLGAAAGAGEAAAGLGTLAGAGEAAAGLGSIGALAGEAAAGIGAAASAAAPIAAAGAEGLTALLAFLPFLSDRRAKENIEPVGKTYDGQTIYRYNYKGDKATQIGLIAQEVEKKHKNAVGSSNGMKTVDYKRATEAAADRGHFYNGGLIPYRRGYADGMTVDEADLPEVGAQDVSRGVTDREPIKEIIRREAEAQGVPYDIALKIAQRESGLNPNAQAKTSSAGGLYQTIDDTFKGMGGTGSKYDPEQNARAGIRYIAQNLKALGAEGDNATAGKAYLGHFLGTGGAKGVLSNPDRPLSETLLNYDKAVASNPFMASWKTGRDALQWAENKMAGVGGEPSPRPPRDVPERTLASQAVAAAKQPSAVAPAQAPEKKDDGSFPIRPPATARGKEQDWSDFLTSKQFILPALTAIGTMGTTPTRDFGTALSAGLLGGVTSYQNLDKSQAELEATRENIPKITAETDEVKMRTRALEAGLYERQWVRGVGMYLVDKTNPRNLVQITDVNLKPIPGTGVEKDMERIPYAKDSPRPEGEAKPPASGAAPKTSELITVKKPGEVSIPKPTSATSWSPMTAVPEGYIPPDQINIEMGDKGKALGTLGADVVKEQNRKAEAAYDQLYALEEMDKQFGNLSSEGFLVPGAYAAERLEFAKRMNTAVQALGGKPIFSDSDVASMESISKNSFRLGSALARSIGSREPGFIVQQSVAANPGIENSPIGYQRISAGLREAAMFEQDKNQFYTEYYSKFGHLDGAEKMFRDANPPKMYADRAILSTVKPDDKADLVAIAAEKNPAKLAKVKEKFDTEYGKGVADKVLGR